jgi:hypothetical protein
VEQPPDGRLTDKGFFVWDDLLYLFRIGKEQLSEILKDIFILIAKVL